MIQKSINYWSFPGGLEGTLTPSAAIQLAKKHGFPALELGIGGEGSALSVTATEQELVKIRAEADSHGVALSSVASGLYWSRAIGDDNEGLRKQAIDDLKKMIVIAKHLGARTLLTIPGAVDVFFLPDRPAQRYDEVLARASEGIAEALATAAEHQVRLGIENVWNRFLLSPTEMLEFVSQFESPWIGAYLDVANVLPFGYPEQWLRILGKSIVGIHFKDFRRAVGTAEGFVDLLEGDVNWPEVMNAIREIGYDGPVVGEMIPLYRHLPEIRVANASRAMDAILQL